jgi:spermidine/putrescine transport system ATP-binding protein
MGRPDWQEMAITTLSAANSGTPVVELAGAVRRFAGTAAVDRVDLEVRRGEFLTLLGPSGSGKTTMLRLIAGFERPDAGDVRIEGRSVVDVPPHRRAIGMVFQNYALFAHHDVGGNIAFGLRMRGVARAEIVRRVGGMLERLGLEGFARRPVHTLSGGQRQRVALARALVTDPAVLLLDEPLAALDLALRRQMQHELKTLQRTSGTTFVLVTHDQEEALSMSDRVAVCRAGRIEQLGPVEDVYHRPRTAFVAALVGEANVLRAEARGGQTWLVDLGVALPLPPVPGGGVCVVLRPELVALGAGAAGRDVRAHGRIRSAAFTGGEAVYKIDSGGTLVTVRAPLRRGEAMLAPDDMTTFGFDAADCATVPVTQGDAPARQEMPQ